jgi:hypothetical protein
VKQLAPCQEVTWGLRFATYRWMISTIRAMLGHSLCILHPTASSVILFVEDQSGREDAEDASEPAHDLDSRPGQHQHGSGRTGQP